MNSAYHHGRAFTIVELLIVIVVIGILAAITLVAYNGTQVRAENSKTLTAVVGQAKLINSYFIDNGTPPGPYNLNSCIGVSPCGLLSGVGDSCDRGQGRPVSSSTLDNNLKSGFGASTIPHTSSQGLNCGTGIYSGSWYWTNGVQSRITFYLRGNQQCPVLPGEKSASRVQNADATACTVFF
jgi:prepilin-type N-terminal cleavage/methylation domain-containing protein